MSYHSREVVCSNIKGVVDVLKFDDSDNSACDGIRKVRAKYPQDELVFANGGDRSVENIPEGAVCEKCHINLEFGIGGDFKANSSSWIVEKWNKK
jgi:hypothetical protein